MTRKNGLPRRMIVVRWKAKGVQKQAYYFNNQSGEIPAKPKSKLLLAYDLDSALAAYAALKAPGTILRSVKRENDKRRTYRAARRRAAAKGIEFTLPYDWQQEQIAAQGGRCAVSGIRFRDEDHGKRFSPWFPSIDRIDSTKGYTPENCRVVCAYINIAMNQFGESFFLSVCAATVRYQRAVAAAAKRQETFHAGQFSNGDDSACYQ